MALQSLLVSQQNGFDGWLEKSQLPFPLTMSVQNSGLPRLQPLSSLEYLISSVQSSSSVQHPQLVETLWQPVPMQEYFIQAL